MSLKHTKTTSICKSFPIKAMLKSKNKNKRIFQESKVEVKNVKQHHSKHLFLKQHSEEAVANCYYVIISNNLIRKINLQIWVFRFIHNQQINSLYKMLKTQPAIFLNHAGGPMPLLKPDFHKSLYQSFNSISTLSPSPKALIVVSAHWIQETFQILDIDDPGLLYDYFGTFCQEAYSLKYPAKSTKQLRQEVINTLKLSGLELVRNKKRQYDHGIFIPLSILYPQAQIPVIQISLKSNFDPVEHFDLGVKLGELRNKGFMVVGSGMTYHNMAGYNNPNSFAKSQNFDDSLRKIASTNNSISENREVARNWNLLPNALDCHPKDREQHFLPFLSILGAAQGEAAKKVNSYELYSVMISDFAFI